MHLWNPINIWQIEFVLIWIYSKGSENRFVVVQHFWCRKICEIVCRVSRKRVKSKFLYQDADVILLADKCLVVRSFVCRNYDKVLMETGKFSDNLRVTETCLMLTERLSRRILRFRTSAIDLTHSERVSTSTSSFLAHRLAYSSHASMMILKFWCHENETGSLYFGPLCIISFSFWLRTILRSPVTLQLHCGYKYTRPCMINRIWGLKQLWLQVNGHAWFYLHEILWAVWAGIEKFKMTLYSYNTFEPTPRHATNGESAL